MNAVLDSVDQPLVDYRNHPAFTAFLDQRPQWPEADIRNAVRVIDQACEDWVRRAADGDPAPSRQVLSTALQGLRALVMSGPTLDADTLSWLLGALDRAGVQLWCELDVLARRAMAAGSKHAATTLATEGFATVPMPRELQARLFRDAASCREVLQARAQMQAGARQWCPLAPEGSISRRIIRHLRDSGGMQLLAAYRGVDMELEHVALHYSHPRQTWYRGCYADAGLADGPLVYLHNDYEPCGVKLLCYLSDLDPGCGEFRFMRGSHQWLRSTFRHVFFKELDRLHSKVFAGRLPPVDYYRPRYLHPSERKRLMQLPWILMGTSHFGDDLLPDEARTQALQRAEVPITATDSMILFDGGRGLHRGGLATTGERWALQIGFRARVRKGVWRSLKSAAKTAVASLSGRP